MCIPAMRSAVQIILVSLLAALAATNAAAQSNLLAGPSSLEFVASDNAAQPPPQRIFVAASNGVAGGNASLYYQAQASYGSGATNWLSIIPSAGVTPSTLSVSVNPTYLAPGVYSGHITITAGSPTPSVVANAINVTLRVGGAGPAKVQASSALPASGSEVVQFVFPEGLTFTANSIAGEPGPQSVFVALARPHRAFTATSSAPWLSVATKTAAAGAQSVVAASRDELQVSVNPSGLIPGQHVASILLAVPGIGQRSIPVTFNVGDDAHLVAEPSAITLKARPGDPVPTFRTITISSTSKNLSYAATSDSGWLAIGPQVGSTAGSNTISLAVTAANLSEGMNTGSIRVTAPGAAEPLVIPISFAVTTQGAGVAASPHNVTIQGTLGGAPQTDMSVQVTSTNSPETFSTSTTKAYLTVVPVTGTTPATLTITADPSTITGPGSYTGFIFIVGSLNEGSDQDFVQVTFIVSGSGTPITVAPTNLTFAQTQGGAAPASQTLMLTSTPSTSFTASTDANWLSVTPVSGSTPATLTVSANANFSTGTYSANVMIVGGGAQYTVPVTLNVSPSANTLSASPTSLSFSQVVGAAAPSAQQVAITSGTPTSFTITTNSNSFLTVSPLSGTTNSFVSVSVNPGTLKTGVYIDSFTITGGGGSPISISVSYSITANTAITANPMTVTFSQVAGGTAPPSQNVSLTSPTATSFTATSGQNFLTVTSSGDTTPATLTLSVNAAGLVPAIYQGQVTIVGGASEVDLTVILNVTASTASPITASPTSVSFSQVSGGTAPASQTVSLTSTASTPFNASSDQTWLSVAPTSGTAGTTAAMLTLSVNAAGLGTGVFNANVTITGGATTVTVPVSFTITSTAPTAISATPSSLTFSQIAGGTAPSPQTVQLSSTTPTNFTAASNQTWLLVTPASGTSNTTNLSISINATGLGAGVYHGTVTVTGGASPVSIPVTLTVTTAAAITASPTSLSFVQVLTGNAPASQTISVTASTTTNFTVAFAAAWLTVSPTTGSTPGTLTVSANGAGMAAGTYSDTITITAGSTSATVPVTLTLLSGSASSIVASPLALVFNQTVGQTSFGVQSIQLNAAVATTFSASTTATWLAISPTTGTTPATLTVTESPVGMTAGTYSSSIMVLGGTATVVIPVTLNLTLPANGITATPASVSFTQILGGAAPSSQTVQLTATAATSYTVTKTQTWLTVTPSSGTTPGSLTLSVSPSGLVAGTYSDTITVNGGANPVTIPVSFTLTADTFSAVPSALSFAQTVGAPAPPSQTVQLSSGTARAYVASSSAAWLSVSPSTGTTPATLTVTANGSSLSVGTYTGTITINGAGSPLLYTVTLTVATASGPIFSPASLTFSVAAGGAAPPAQTVLVASPGSDFGFTATATASNAGASNGNWLSVSPANGTTPTTLTVTVTPTGLVSGTYSGIVTVTPTDGTSPAQSLAVTLTVNGSTTIMFVRSILSGASFLPGPVSPGELISVFGSGLGPSTGVSATPLSSGSIDTQLAGTQVLFDGVAAPILYVRADQINAVVPYNVYGRTITSMQVVVGGAQGTAVGLQVQNTAPAVFTMNSSGGGQASVINEDGTINSPYFPAPRGSVIAIYGTGEGQTNPPGQDGRIIGTDLRNPLASWSATIGGIQSEVQYMGSAPTLISGVFQMNVLVPDGVPPGGQVPIELMIGGVPTQTGATVAVK
jgi:uncharacterized protein (TIGR03437 family)